MLTRIAAKNFALLRDTDVSLKAGFTVITGETGSGKSLLVLALSFLGGEKVSTEIIRDGETKAIVEGEFISAVGDPIILRRELFASGRTRAFYNDSPVSVKSLAEAASSLFDITSQRAFSHLLEPDRHLDFLDLYSGLLPARKTMEDYERDYLKLKRQIAGLLRKKEEFRQRREIIDFQLEQINEIDPQISEEEELNSEIRRLENFEELHGDGQQIVNSLVRDTQSVDVRLQDSGNLLQRVGELDSTLAELIEDLDSAKAIVREIASRVEERCLRVNYEAHLLEELRERQHAIAGLVRKFGGTYTAMLEKRDSLRAELTSDEKTDIELETLESQSERIVTDWALLAKRVSKTRTSAAQRLQRSVERSMAKLGVNKAVFEARFRINEDLKGLFEREGKRCTLSGRGGEDVEFMFSANPGMEPRPLVNVASGGELSRLLLAIKESLPVSSSEATTIFDEIDSGVSGKVAHLVGNKLKSLSRDRQMVAITHLPQIAAIANHHFKVHKHPHKGKIETSFIALEDQAKVEEIATMISGGEITDAALEQARHLIEGAES
ncbi:MAG: DNA repair protein RecN [Calditrichaeota bacterium]|nr:DNA repair protein RecN [Calditrichota bacterium]MBT7617244.1 DNA repair protein RecN [Calditrichota bacterium]MBT7788509.1 DNA repair protein RecN [Calditrichota bacterium]